MAKTIYSRRPSARVLPPLPEARPGIYDMSPTTDEIVSAVLVSNLHCSSCVHTIEETLSSLSPPPIAVDISIVTQTITVRHSQKLSPTTIKTAIDGAGFDIVATPTDCELSFTGSFSRLPPLLQPKRVKHIQQCTHCQIEHEKDGSHDLLRDKFGEDTLIPVLPQLRSAESAFAVDNPKDSSLTDLSSSSPHPLGPQHVTLSVAGMTCASCSNTVTNALRELAGVSDIAVNLLGGSATVVVENNDCISSVVQTIEDAGYDAEVVSVEPVNSPVKTARRRAPRAETDGPFRVTFSVGGMTCSSCTSTVTALATAMTGVSDVGVSLIGKSATAIITRKELVEELKEAIENAGYEPEIMGIEPVQSDIDESDQAGPRTVTLRVEGMFCSHCPEKVMSLLDPLLPRITILTPITSYTEPILRLSYLPSLPDFTIRTIIDAISTPNASHPFTATIHHPPTLEERARHMHRREQHALLRRLLFSFIAAIPTFIIGIVYMSLVPSSNNVRIWLMRPLWTGNASRVQWALFFLATPVMFYSAGMFHQRSLKELWALWRKGSRTPVWKRFVRFGSMNLLVSTGVSVAYFSSIALLALAASQEASPSGEGDATTYFDSVVLLTMFLLAGRFLEAYSKGRTADAITALGRLRPTTALLVNQSYFAGNLSSPNLAVTNSDDPEKGVPSESHPDVVLTPESALLRISAELLEIGDVVRVQHGASPPADGILANIIGDQALFDESSLTGESRPIRKGVGERVYVGTINRGAVVDVRVDATGGETMLDHIVKVVREGQTRRAPIERLADMITGYFVPVVTLLAIITWIVWLALGLSGTLPSDYLDIPVGGWPVWSLEFAIAVFVVACPCGIGLAAPTALLVGSGLAARYGILVRGGGEAFQEAAQLDLVVFDKTGTLSEGGDPRVTDAVTFPSLVVPRKDEVLFGIAAELESISTHPLAGAIRSYCVANGAASRVGPAIAFQETAGRGVKANFKEQEGIIGNEAWMAEHEAVIDGKMEARLNAWKSEGKSVALLALREGDGTAFEIRAIFAVADPLRSEASAVVSSLQDQGIGTWMISGDNAVTARAVARIVGIPETNVIAGVLPHEKAQKVQWLQQVGMKRVPRGWRRWIGTRNLNSRCIVAMVGDGINDAPALTAADVGIAIGSGSDVAISSASFILVSSNLTGLLTLIDLSRTVFNRVKFNFLWASIYNIIALPIAAGVIYPAAHHPRLAPVWASLAMALSSVSVVCSSLLLRLYREPPASRAR